MGFITEILGAFRQSEKPARRSIADVEAALRRVHAERQAALGAIETAARERDELLLLDGTDKQIAELDARADGYRLILERCEKIEPLLTAELQGLRSQKKQEEWELLSKAYDEAAREFSTLFRATLKMWEELIAMRANAQGAGFQHEADKVLAVPPYTLTNELISSFETAMDRHRDAAARRHSPPSPKPPPPAPKLPAPKPPPSPAPPRKTAPAALSPTPKAPPAPFVPTPDADGNVRVVVTKSGFELEPGQRANIGEVVSIPLDKATAAVRATTAEFADYDEAQRRNGGAK